MAKRKNKLTFEESMEKLRTIVRELEDGNLSLSDSLIKYESGIGHLQQCYQDLAEAERKIKQLVRVDQDGKLITQPFDDKASHPIETTAAPAGKGYSDEKSAVHIGNDCGSFNHDSETEEAHSGRLLFASKNDSDGDEVSDDSDDGEENDEDLNSFRD